MREEMSIRAVERLIDELDAVDRTEPAGVGLIALGRLVRKPRLAARLDEYARSFIRGLADRSVADGKPISVALASLDRDGHVRERAVAAIAARPHPELAPFLVLRTGDWVDQVRVPARAALATLLAEWPARYVPAVLPMARQTAGRWRTRFAYAQVEAAVLNAPDELRSTLAASRHFSERRLAFAAGLARGRLSYADLRSLAVGERDVLIRSQAAGLVCREALWQQDAKTLRTLAEARSADVRAEGYTGLVRLGLATEVAAALDDDAPLVRAIARDAARRAGVDAAAHYRAAIAGGEPAPGAVAGLAELGFESDAPALARLLGHPSDRLRAAAVRALAQLGAVHIDEVLPLLHDPAAAVVREASAALRRLSRRLPPGLGEELMRDPRPEVRRAGYRLAGPAPQDRFRAALVLAMDPDRDLAERGRADALGLASRRLAPREQERRDELIALVEQARPVLGEATDDMLAVINNAVEV